VATAGHCTTFRCFAVELEQSEQRRIVMRVTLTAVVYQHVEVFGLPVQ